ncbi:MAG: branched-chain amino acid ABC transporter permease, partial [Thermoactinomycetaceae bacterium]|nr:branched-chain amino acid ABC transporter permease [Thermoactinomycetaceae bacterium]
MFRTGVGAVRSRQEWRKGLASAVPIAIGYIPIAIAFGVIARQSGLSFAETVMM